MALLLLAPGLSVSHGRADDGPDQPLPTITRQQLADEIRSARKRYEQGYLDTIYRQIDTIRRTQDDNEQPQTVDMHGRFHSRSDGDRWRVEYNGQIRNSNTNEISARRWSAGFDGMQHWNTASPNGALHVGEKHHHESIPPQYLFWTDRAETLADTLTNQEFEFGETVLLEGHRCYVLAYQQKARGIVFRTELTVSPRQDFLPVRYQSLQNGIVQSSHELFNLTTDSHGVWYPKQIVRVTKFQNRKRRDIRVRRFESQHAFQDNDFRMDIPWRSLVRDNRTGRIYLHDPWWPEAAAFLREKYDWPPVDLTPLQHVSSYAEESIDQQPAPPWRVRQWVQGAAPDLTGNRVTLLHFWTGSLQFGNAPEVAALRELDRVYAPHGLQIAGVITQETDRDQVMRMLAEARITWPTAIDEPGTRPASYGLTFDAFRLKAYKSIILVDHTGQVHTVNSGALADQTRSLLEAAGARDVPRLSLGFVRSPPGMELDLRKEWRTWVREAAKTSQLNVRVTHGDQPAANVDVTARLQLEISGSAHTTAATTILPYDEIGISTVTNDAGEARFARVCKGTYRLTCVYPDGRTVTQMVSIPADNSETLTTVSLPESSKLQ